MADTLLLIHSYFRWIVLFSFALSLVFLVTDLLRRGISEKFKKIHKLASILLSIQFLLGILVYSSSPLISSSLENMAETMKNKEQRYFVVEHTFSMFLALGLMHFLSSRFKKDIPSEKLSKIFGISYFFLILLFAYGVPHATRPLFR